MLPCRESSWLRCHHWMWGVETFTSLRNCSSHWSWGLLNKFISMRKGTDGFLFKQSNCEHSHNIWTEICNMLPIPTFLTSMFHYTPFHRNINYHNIYQKSGSSNSSSEGTLHKSFRMTTYCNDVMSSRI